MEKHEHLKEEERCGSLDEGEFESKHETETALSSGVKNLLCVYGFGKWPTTRQADDGSQRGNQENDNTLIQKFSAPMLNGVFLDRFGILDLGDCSRFVELNEDSQRDALYYARAAFELAPTFTECEKIWSQRSLEEFTLECQKYLQWTGQQQLFLDCFGILTEGSESRNILALLLLCTGIEQCLRNLFLLENEQCPMLLKDILASKEVEKCIGEAATQLLQILLGPPISMNLRNVAWHGFLCEGEISPRYTYFLLVFIASLGSQLTSAKINECSMGSRQYASLCKVDCIRSTLRVDFLDGQLDRIKGCILDSWVAAARNKTLIQDVFDLHTEKRYGFSSMQGFPILEHALRRRFVKVNNCPNRLLTAEATTLYTTYEEILDCHLPDGQRNRLVCDLGEPFMDLLHDLLIYPSGPRARDRLGHGEADVYDTPASLSLTVIICLCYLSAKSSDGINLDKHNLQPQPVQDVVASVENYESQFHPITELKGKILRLSLKSSQIHTCLRTNPDLQLWSPDNQPDIFIEDNPTFHCIVPLLSDLLCHMDKDSIWDPSQIKSKLAIPFENVHDTITEALRQRVTTLHRWQNKVKCQESNISESEIISLMHRVVAEMSTVLDQMESVLEHRQEALDNRVLRSRQRDNTKRLIKLFPNIILGVNYLNIVWAWLFRLLNHPEKELSPLFRIIQKFLKATLQLVENLRTSTSKENNKWTKADEMLVTLVQRGVEFIQGLGM